MHLVRKARNVWRGVLQTYGSEQTKKALWDREFTGGRWACLESTPDDCLYPYIHKYAKGGLILDLGCGSGNTSNEIDASKYRHYTGVDISDTALQKAREKSARNGRTAKNEYIQGDIISYVPAGRYDLIVFRDSIVYIPRWKIGEILKRYAKYLDVGGVLIVRLANGNSKYKPYIETIRAQFEVLETLRTDEPDAVVIVFRMPEPAPLPFDHRILLRARLLRVRRAGPQDPGADPSLAIIEHHVGIV
jgi:SAM-dependent methyltransferase